MNEKIFKTKKNGMKVLVLTLFGLAIAIGLLVFGGLKMDAGNYYLGVPFFAVGLIYALLGWIPLLGLKILKPQEALVLTLFGKYIGTIKGEGFYAVNPFCSAVNPAANTKLNQSGDVNTVEKTTVNANGVPVVVPADKRISLKIMTLNNNRQKINDCLGNPVEIGIAVTWRIVDTAKAVFNVDNYKEFLSLQCDSSLRNIVRLYPYDVAPGVDTTGDGVAELKAYLRKQS